MIGYNRMTGYNKARYNGDGYELSTSDGFSIADSTVTKDSRKVASELVILADTTAKQQNKSVTENIRLNAWLRQERDDSGKWSD